MLQFLVGCGGGDEQAFLVAGGQAADDAGSGNGGVADGYDILEFGFEDTARVLVLKWFTCGAVVQSVATGERYTHL
ncbi:MAG: hypothetical protein EOO38_29060 [Cytophagaceae bacterium]|nr:MAG: hypothetical protein EOO38_29060 [Cytophagaceae bacterium]